MTGMNRWGKYLIQKPAVAKGSRYVYRGFDLSLEREVAIKVYKSVEGGRKEADTMKRYGSHIRLPLFYEYIVEKDRGYIVMEFVEGNRLNVFNEGLARDAKTAVQITYNLLDGLEHLHEHGILHFDLAPHNILIENDCPDRVKITDFCSSIRQDDDGIWRSKRSGGTVNFMPPEQKTAPVRLYPCSDLFSVSRICYWLICRSLPKAYGSLKLRDKNLRDILAKGMDNDMKKRYQSAGEFMEDLRCWQSLC